MTRIREAILLGYLTDRGVGLTDTLVNLLASLLLHPIVWCDTVEVLTEQDVEGRDVVAANLCQLVECTHLRAVVLNQRAERGVAVEHVVEETHQHLRRVVETQHHEENLDRWIVQMTTLDTILQVAVHTIEEITQRLVECYRLELILQSGLTLEEFREHTDVARTTQGGEVSHDELGVAGRLKGVVVALVAEYHMTLVEPIGVALLGVNLQSTVHKEYD